MTSQSRWSLSSGFPRKISARFSDGELNLPFLNLSRCFGRAAGASATDLPDFYRVTALCRFLTAATAKLEEDRSSAFEVEKSHHSGEVWEGEEGERHFITVQPANTNLELWASRKNYGRVFRCFRTSLQVTRNYYWENRLCICSLAETGPQGQGNPLAALAW